VSEEVRAQTGRPFEIFLDKVDIGGAADWDERLREALRGVDVLIPMLTPGFLNSDWCRREVMLFSDKERLEGVRAMFPLHYIQTELFEHPETDGTVRTLRKHEWFEQSTSSGD
jgi:TIR domain